LGSSDYCDSVFLALLTLHFETFFSTGGSSDMFGLFGKTSEIEKLQKQYKKVLEESYKLSHSNRAASDQKMVEAEEIYKKIESLKAKAK
jgi:hypothetical protein